MILNGHQGTSPYFEWLRVVQAISNGAVVVTEHSAEHLPLVPGRHFVSGDIESLALLASQLLDDDRHRFEVQSEAYRMLREELPMRRSVEVLLETATEVARVAPIPSSEDFFFHQPQPKRERLAVFSAAERPSSASPGNVNGAALRRAITDVKLELLDLRRQLTRIESPLGSGRAPAERPGTASSCANLPSSGGRGRRGRHAPRVPGRRRAAGEAPDVLRRSLGASTEVRELGERLLAFDEPRERGGSLGVGGLKLAKPALLLADHLILSGEALEPFAQLDELGERHDRVPRVGHVVTGHRNGVDLILGSGFDEAADGGGR